MTDLRNVTVAILAGGLGTRLRPMVSDRPKALAAVGGRPFLAFLLDRLVIAGARNVVLCTGYLGDQVRACFGARYCGLHLSYSQESAPLGTAGALRLAAPHLASDPVLVMNADSLCLTDLSAFLHWHLEVRAHASLLLARVSDAGRYGRVAVDADGFIRTFEEKREERGPAWISAGTYLLDRSVLESLAAGETNSLERDVFPAWIGRGLFGYRCPGRFLDIGIPEAYAAAPAFLGEVALAGGGAGGRG